MAKGGQPETVTQTSQTVSEPWEAAQPYLKQVFDAAQQNFNAAKSDELPDRVAPLDPNTIQAQQNVVGQAAPQMRNVAQAGVDATHFGLTGALQGNPYLDSAIDSATRPIIQNLMEQALPGIRSDSVLSGNLGSTRQGVAEGQAIGRAADAVGDVGTNMAFAGYDRGLDTFERTLAMIPQTQQTLLAPEMAQDAVGQQSRQLEQELLNQGLQNTLFEQDKDDIALARYASIVGGNFGGSATTTSTAPGQSQSPYSGVGGMMAGASLGTQLFPGPWGAGIGAGAGLLFGLLG